jgi:hypothetical protein
MNRAIHANVGSVTVSIMTNVSWWPSSGLVTLSACSTIFVRVDLFVVGDDKDSVVILILISLSIDLKKQI